MENFNSWERIHLWNQWLCPYSSDHHCVPWIYMKYSFSLSLSLSENIDIFLRIYFIFISFSLTAFHLCWILKKLDKFSWIADMSNMVVIIHFIIIIVIIIIGMMAIMANVSMLPVTILRDLCGKMELKKENRWFLLLFCQFMAIF